MKILILCGGTSSEKEVSIWSAENVYKSLINTEYIVEMVDIATLSPYELCQKILCENFDLVFPVLHGKPGEDGSIQGFLDTLGIKYIGSGVFSCAITMDKYRYKLICKSLEFPQPDFIAIRTKDSTEVLEFVRLKGFPLVVKPNSQGSSVGVSIVNNNNELKDALELGFKYDPIVLVEEFIHGKEITCGVIGNSNVIALPLVEILPKTKFFDYESKYNPQLCDEIVPARLNDNLKDRLQELAIKAYKAFDCKCFGRVDMFVDKYENIYLSEINTIPGLTANSLFTKEVKAAGYSFQEIVKLLVKLALED
ncbi:D-alanine--D-alanine ligase [Thermodesulfobium narugense DSM 14796]|uniref:D-alanine--D-alanine ligase n=1 Tax=Thermodesulfobium narugense DSM 14796 TaxID=747365 RepID=M1E6S7_9BACT|nr:D-alanine--D-alanine ligase [Thermodesulfobium narugense]AEE14303.1 D-alanine--D-alanine ligase [Thermodesulfobium narugense DSM 14796]